MVFQRHISTSSLNNLGEVLRRMEQHCVSLEILTLFLLQADQRKEMTNAVYELLWERVSYLQQTVFDIQTFYSAISAGKEFG